MLTYGLIEVVNEIGVLIAPVAGSVRNPACESTVSMDFRLFIPLLTYQLTSTINHLHLKYLTDTDPFNKNALAE